MPLFSFISPANVSIKSIKYDFGMEKLMFFWRLNRNKQNCFLRKIRGKSISFNCCEVLKI